MLDPAAPAYILAAAETFGPPAILVNAVGGNVAQGVFAESDPAQWMGDIDLNFGTVLRITRAVLPGMIERACGSIINIRSEEHTSELQSLMRISYAVFCLKKKKTKDRLH